MSKNLVIVESPAKAKTIENYLGKDFVVKSSFGHIRDLPKNDRSIDIKNGFEPLYEVSDDKKAVISELRKLAKQSEVIWLATDDDREGEAISWHLKEALNLKDEQTKRIVFREITKPAILKAIENPRGIDYDLVNAQQARRVLDRLVGFELSPLLWKKIRRGLSAGRVQSVAVRLIVEREREIERFNSQSFFKVVGQFLTTKNRGFKAELNKKFSKEEEANTFLTECIGASYTVNSLETKPAKRTPAAPFTTSTLQQEASNKLGFSVSQTMTLAQRLYEAGHITYMRTDSVNLSELAIESASKEIASSYGDHYIKTRKYKTKSESAQEAHEAIRPTNFANHSVGSERNEKRLYELIWKRAIASQMADAELERTNVAIAISSRPELFQATGEVIKFDGFLKVYIEHDYDKEELQEGEEQAEEEGMLPAMEVGMLLGNEQMKATQRFSKPSARYTEASLVKKLEEMGIGRPSTYAPTISTIIKREYVVKDSRDGKQRQYIEFSLSNGKILKKELTENYGVERNKLFPTDMGTVVTDFLVQYFPAVVDYGFTAEVEQEFDKIANGKVVWNQMIAQFYKGFHETIEQTEHIERSDVPNRRDLGVHPETGTVVFCRLGKFGPLVQIGDPEQGEEPRYANIPKHLRLESITLEEALELFRLPRPVGEFEGKGMIAAVGKFGPYIKHDNKFISIPKDLDPLTISEEQAVVLIEDKRKKDAEKFIKTFEEDPEVQVLNGRWGAYVSFHGVNLKIPKDKVAAELSFADVMELNEADGGKTKKKVPAKTAAPKPAPKPKTAAAKKTTAKTSTAKKTSTTTANKKK